MTHPAALEVRVLSRSPTRLRDENAQPLKTGNGLRPAVLAMCSTDTSS